MLTIAGQTAGPNGLNFLWTLIGGRGCFRLYIFFFYNGKRWALQLVYLYKVREINISELKKLVYSFRYKCKNIT